MHLVDVGAERKLTIATAATNVAEGQVIPVATIGAKLPELTIEPRKMRGVASEGMLISAGELALEADWFEDGILQIERDLPLGANAIDLLGLGSTRCSTSTSPRPICVDAMSMLGLARELAASFGVPAARTVDGQSPRTQGETDDVRVTLESARRPPLRRPARRRTISR